MALVARCIIHPLRMGSLIGELTIKFDPVKLLYPDSSNNSIYPVSNSFIILHITSFL